MLTAITLSIHLLLCVMCCSEEKPWWSPCIDCTALTYTSMNCLVNDGQLTQVLRDWVAAWLLWTGIFQTLQNKKIIQGIQRLRSNYSYTPQLCCKVKPGLNRSSHQILLFKMNIPGVEVPIENLLPRILGRLGKKPSKTTAQRSLVPVYRGQVPCNVVSSDTILLIVCPYKSQVNYCMCMPGSRECCLAYECMHIIRSYVSELLQHSRTQSSTVWRHEALQPAFREPSRLRI